MAKIIEIARYNNIVMEQINGCNGNGGFIAGYAVKANGTTMDYAMADDTRGWETLRRSYACIAKAYNNLVPVSEAIPTF